MIENTRVNENEFIIQNLQLKLLKDLFRTLMGIVLTETVKISALSTINKLNSLLFIQSFQPMIVESIRDLTQEVRFSHEQRLSELGRLEVTFDHPSGYKLWIPWGNDRDFKFVAG